MKFLLQVWTGAKQWERPDIWIFLFNHMILDRLHFNCNWLYKIYVCIYKCDISNLAVKEEPDVETEPDPDVPRGKSTSPGEGWAGRSSQII